MLHHRGVLHNGGVLHCIVLHCVRHCSWCSSKSRCSRCNGDDCDDGGYAYNFYWNLPL